MITTRKIAAAALLSLSFIAAAATVHSLPAASNESKVTITAAQQPSGETMTVVTVVAKRLNAKDKIAATFAAAFADSRDAMVTHAHG
jgi:translation initiation factor 1 (eIF-1/SUI1)